MKINFESFSAQERANSTEQSCVKRDFIIGVANDMLNMPDKVIIKFSMSRGKPVMRFECTFPLPDNRFRTSRRWSYIDETTIETVLKMFGGTIQDPTGFVEEEHPVDNFEGDFELEMLKQNIQTGSIPTLDGEFKDRQGQTRLRLITSLGFRKEIHYTPVKTDELMDFLRENQIINQEVYFK